MAAIRFRCFCLRQVRYSPDAVRCSDRLDMLVARWIEDIDISSPRVQPPSPCLVVITLGLCVFVCVSLSFAWVLVSVSSGHFSSMLVFCLHVPPACVRACTHSFRSSPTQPKLALPSCIPRCKSPLAGLGLLVCLV